MTLYNRFFDSSGKSPSCTLAYLEDGRNLLHKKQTEARECGKKCYSKIVAEVKKYFAFIDDDWAKTRCVDLSGVFDIVEKDYRAFVALGDPRMQLGLKSFAQADIREPPPKPVKVNYDLEDDDGSELEDFE